MNNRHLLSFLQSGYTTASVRFIQNRQASMLESNISRMDDDVLIRRYLAQIVNPDDKQYTYKVFFNVMPGDVCMVETNTGLKLVEVVEVHDEPQIDPDSNIHYRWLVARIDLSAYLKVLRNEVQLLTELNRAEAKRKVENIRQELLGNYTAKPQSFEAAIAANTFKLEDK